VDSYTKEKLFESYDLVGFEVLTAGSMKMAVFWVVAPCRALMMEAESTSETSVNFYQTTRRYNPEDSNLQVMNCFNFKLLVTRKMKENSFSKSDCKKGLTFSGRLHFRI
jgi:hypothetical protein